MKLEAKALIKPFEALQGVGKIKISVNFLSSSVIGTERVKSSNLSASHFAKSNLSGK